MTEFKITYRNGQTDVVKADGYKIEGAGFFVFRDAPGSQAPPVLAIPAELVVSIQRLSVAAAA
jgi:hypothetical protein